MTKHDDVEERAEVDARLLEVMLVERFGGRGEALCDEAPRQVPMARRPRGASWLTAAALLLGAGVVTAIALQRRTPAEHPAGPAQVVPRFVAQDPNGPEVVVPKNFDEFRSLLAHVQRVELHRYDSVGSYRTVTESTITDTLDLVPWPERFVVEGDGAEVWLAALRQINVVPEAVGNGFEDSFRLMLALPGNRLVHCFLSWGQNSQLWIADNTPIRPGGDLQRMLSEAIVDMTRRHALAGGVVTEVDDFARHGAAIRLDVPAALLPQMPLLAGLRRLRVKGTADVAGWQHIARLQQLESLELAGATIGDVSITAVLAMRELRELRLRGCAGLDGAALRRLATMRRLAMLHLSDLPLGDDAAAFEALASLPMLREFGVRFVESRVPAGVLEPLQRTKLERLLLVDVPVDLDLAPLQQLPSLHELVVVGPLDDAALAPLREVRSLRRLTLRNCRLSAEGAAALRAALPACQLDWLPNQRWFDTGFAFDYAPK